MEKKIFVSGSTGLLGAHLLVELAKSHDRILALYRDQKSIEEVQLIFKYYQCESNFGSIEWQEGDILDVERLQELMHGIDQVYHCAALVSFDPSDAVDLHKINVEGTRNMLNSALSTGVSKFLHVSSTATIGSAAPSGYCTESSIFNTDEKHTFYAKSKYSAEREVYRASEEGLETVIINPCVIIGPGDSEKSSGSIFSSIYGGLKFYTEGANAFVDARDVASVMIKLMNSDVHSERFLCISENLKFKVLFNEVADEMGVKRPSIKASPMMTSIAWRLLKVGAFFSGKSPKITSESARASHKITRFSNQKIKDEMAYEFVPVKDAIKNAVSYLRFIQKLK